MNYKTILFFRNDHERLRLDKPLVERTNLFIKDETRIEHVIELANIKFTIVEWLLALKLKYSNFVVIIQHAYSNKVNFVKFFFKSKKGKSGCRRGYEIQYKEIKKIARTNK